MTSTHEGAEDPRELNGALRRAALAEVTIEIDDAAAAKLEADNRRMRELAAAAVGGDPAGGHEHEIRLSEDPAAEAAIERTKIKSSIPAELRELADEYVMLRPCEGCGDLIRAELPIGWEELVNGGRFAIPIVGCGSPWHYVEQRTPSGWLRSMGDPMEAEPGTLELELELQLPDATKAIETLRWPAELRLPVAGDALELPAGIAIVSGITFRCGIEVDATHAELEPFAQRIGATLIKGTER